MFLLCIYFTNQISFLLSLKDLPSAFPGRYSTLQSIHSGWSIKSGRSLPPARGGGPQSSTTPCPSRTDTALLIFVLEFSRSVFERKVKWILGNRKDLNIQQLQVLKSQNHLSLCMQLNSAISADWLQKKSLINTKEHDRIRIEVNWFIRTRLNR